MTYMKASNTFLLYVDGKLQGEVKNAGQQPTNDYKVLFANTYSQGATVDTKTLSVSVVYCTGDVLGVLGFRV